VKEPKWERRARDAGPVEA